jgi:hypothetical protein
MSKGQVAVPAITHGAAADGGDKSMGQTLTRAAQAAALESLRRQFFELGRVPEAGLPAPVMRSWQRCRKIGLDECDMRRVDNATRSEFAMARERNGRLLSHASGVMEHLYEQIRASGSMVVLADAQGMILHAIGVPASLTAPAVSPCSRGRTGARSTVAPTPSAPP